MRDLFIVFNKVVKIGPDNEPDEGEVHGSIGSTGFDPDDVINNNIIKNLIN
ncbi:hypothetical protein KFK09_024850 [Dendrobium nobile]|uniref:Uncharacterized protein n=1 Tax=Dendrobium nobile TaxID=94219 RepID=A0A8T3AEA3_DENNO|nr:hypothetical protein KFK09_024850 [Dendrobium nobile]